MGVRNFDRKFGAEFVESLPGSPGVYLIYDRQNELIYVGKAKNLKRSEEHTSELQSQFHLVCRLLLEKKNFDRRRDLLSAQRDLDDVLDVLDLHPVPRRLLAFDRNLEIVLADDLVGECVDRAGDLLQHGSDLVGQFLDHLGRVAGDLDPDHRPHAGGEHVDFFFNDPATTEIYTLSLHDALPI